MTEFAAFRERIIAICGEHPYYTYNHLIIQGREDFPEIFVKYGYRSCQLHAEARTQKYVHNLAQSDPTAPCVPEILDVFEDDHGRVYVVKELITEPKLDAWLKSAISADVRCHTEAVKKVAAAISWLHACPRPSDTRIGPVGGGVIQHCIFGRFREAPIVFAHAAALQAYINEALSRAPPGGRCTVNISAEPLLLCASEITPDNFYLDRTTGKVGMLSFGHVSFVPESLASLALSPTRSTFVEEVSRLVSLPTDKRNVLGGAGMLIVMLGARNLDMDEHGRKRSRTRRSRRSRKSAVARATVPSSDTVPKIRSPLASSWV
ncbi:hypothetical protein NEOLEDRAFT_1143065 [Neolentinus lepideus HHB14362 ss-1]|uniref:Aminoglycoside phosphotransferase domain-containing protein n=1 Tax=Neolentinus lepideus HHB14362 ss-1 TaxID=1314782 RepID=A0A165MS26_9AGAM|nr:hypothetical protein NEOLEDRAFT_1143065 [Neolentinus lepideus HHB14362 ss-1]